MESLKIDLYSDEVFVFTPKGDVLALPRGATPLDFAYSIHTEVGHRTVGASVNGRLVSLSHELASGDSVEIITRRDRRRRRGTGCSSSRLPAREQDPTVVLARAARGRAGSGPGALLQAMRKQGLPVDKILEERPPPDGLRRPEVPGPRVDARRDRRRAPLHRSR